MVHRIFKVKMFSAEEAIERGIGKHPFLALWVSSAKDGKRVKIKNVSFEISPEGILLEDFIDQLSDLKKFWEDYDALQRMPRARLL